MKKFILSIVFSSLFAGIALSQQVTVQKKDPAGIWKFSIPEAPEGYRSGTLNVVFTDKKYSANMLFPEYNINLAGEKVSFASDSLLFTMYAEGQEVTILLKMTGPQKMEGKALYSEGELLLSMSKEKSGR